MASITLFSPSSYPTLSRQVGSETEMACGVNGGTDWPNVDADPAVNAAILVVVQATSAGGWWMKKE